MNKINHEQILNIADIIASQKYALNKQRSNTIKQYVEEQQANEQRAKKVEELLEEYQYLLTIIDLNDLPQVKRIQALEEELK